MEAIQRIRKGVIIGCGKIAGIYSNEETSLNEAYSYCEAIKTSKFLKIHGCADLEYEKANQLAEKFNIPEVSNNYFNLIKKIKPDFVIVSTSTESHFEIVNKILTLKCQPKLVIVEKPLCLSRHELDILKEKVNTKKIKIIINHSRRFDIRFKELKEQILKARFGEIYRIDIFSYGEWQKNGIHLMDIIGFLFGKSINVDSLKVNSKKVQIKSTKWTDLFLDFGGKFILNINHNPEKYYQLFEMDFKFEKGRISFKDFERKVSIKEKKVNSMNENILSNSNFKFSKRKKSNMTVLIDEVQNFFNGNTDMKSYSIDEIDLSMNLFFKVSEYYEG